VAQRFDRALCLVAVSAAILLSACGGSTSPAPGKSAVAAHTPAQSSAPIAAQARGSTVTAIERVDAWSADGGQAELRRLAAAIVTVGHADTPGASYAGLDKACVTEAAAVASAQDGPPVPAAAEEAAFAGALTEYAKSAADCQAGATAHSVALLNKAAAATRAGTTDILRFDNETKDAQSQAAQSAAGRKCTQLFQAWKTGPAKARLSQFLAGLKALQVAGSGKNLAAVTAAARNAGQAAGQIARYPVPACADPGADFAAILTRVRAAAASAATAKTLAAVVQALAPLNQVPALEAQFTAEVKLTAGA
jgi:hypothetical protein